MTLPIIGSLFAFILLWSGWRGARRPFPRLLGGWHGFLAVGITVVVLQDPGGFHVKGDTAGFDIDLAMIGLVFFGAWAPLALWWTSAITGESLHLYPPGRAATLAGCWCLWPCCRCSSPCCTAARWTACKT